jgi:hypothetical protein
MNRFEEQVEGTGSGTTQATSFQATCLMPWTMPALVYLGSSHVLVPPQLIYAAAYEKSRLAVGRHVARFSENCMGVMRWGRARQACPPPPGPRSGGDGTQYLPSSQRGDASVPAWHPRQPG